MLNSCFLVLERGYTSGYTSKNVSLPLAEAMPFCSGFRPGVDERIERKERALTKVVGVHGSYPRLRFQ